jgi:uncharacterized membrane protein
MTLETSKNLGGIGALLIVIGCLAMFGYGYAGLLGLIGIILLLIGTKGMADYYKESGVFNNALYAFIVTIVGGVVAVAVFIMGLLSSLASLGVTDWTEWAMEIQQSATATDWTAVWDLIWPIVTAGVAALVVLFIALVVTAVLYRKSLVTLAQKSGVKMFETAGLLMLIGAVLTIIIIGFLLIWIAFILITVAFFSIRSAPPSEPSTPPAPS